MLVPHDLTLIPPVGGVVPLYRGVPLLHYGFPTPRPQLDQDLVAPRSPALCPPEKGQVGSLATPKISRGFVGAEPGEVVSQQADITEGCLDGVLRKDGTPS